MNSQIKLRQRRGIALAALCVGIALFELTWAAPPIPNAVASAATKPEPVPAPAPEHRQRQPDHRERTPDRRPAPLQRIIKEEGKATPPFWRSVLAKQAAGDMQLLKNNGVNFTEVQYAAFRKAMDPVYAMLQTRPSGDLLDRIRRA